MKSVIRMLVVPGVIVIVNVAVHGQATQPSTQPDASATAEKDSELGDAGALLAGPDVKEDVASGDFGGNPRQHDRMPISIEQWIGALRSVDLTPQQQTEVRRISVAFREARQAFNEKHGRELRELTQQARQARQNGEPIRPEVRRKLQAIRQMAPDPTAYQQQTWEMLTPQQQATFEQAIADLREEMLDRRRQRRAAGDRDDADRGMMAGDDEDADQERRTLRDEQGKRRFKFLQRHQSKQRPGGQPTEEDREFRFDD